MPILNRRNITTSGFDEDALVSHRANDVIQNFAVLRTTGDLADGIYGNANGVKVTNRGVIDVAGDGAAGIFIEGNDALINNLGSVQTHGGIFDPDGVPFTGDEFSPDAIRVAGDRYWVENNGDVRASGSQCTAIIAIGNGGTVRNYSQLFATGEGAAGVFTVGDHNEGVNRGAITVSGLFSQGMFFFGSNNSVSNIGTLSATSDLFGYGILAIGDSNRVANTGTIRIDSAYAGFGMLAEGWSNQLLNAGTIYASGQFVRGVYLENGSHLLNSGAIYVDGDYGKGVFVLGPGVSIDNSGSISTIGTAAIGLEIGYQLEAAPNGWIINSGQIQTHGAGAQGVRMLGDGSHVSNTGTIETFGGMAIDEGTIALAANAVFVSGDGAAVINSKSGRIVSHEADSAAIALDMAFGPLSANPTGHSTLENYGLIRASKTAIVAGDASETVLNYGTIIGDVILGGGDDTYLAGRGGTLAGLLTLGAGDDLVILCDGSGRTVISDFLAGTGSDDVLDVSAFDFHNLAGVLAAARQVGNDVVISLDRDDQVVLKNVTFGQLSADDFNFASSHGVGGHAGLSGPEPFHPVVHMFG